MEVCWEIMVCAYIIADILIKGFVYYCFARPFMLNKKGALWSGIAYSATMIILYFIPLEMNNMAAYSLGILAGFFVMCGTDRRNYCQKIFIATTFFSLRWLCAYMTTIISGIGEQWIVQISYISEHPVWRLAAYGGIWFLELVIGFAIIGISVNCIVRAYVYKRDNMSIREMFMLCAPSIVAMTEYGIIKRYQTYFETVTGEVYWGNYSGLSFLHYAVSIISIVAMTVIFQNIKARQEDEQQKKLLAIQIDSIRQHIEQVEGLYQNIRSLRHDMTNHILTLENLYGAQETEAAKAYGEDLKAALAEITGEGGSGNPVTDVILLEMKNAAQKKKINFNSDFHYPAGNKINAFDISVILNNALQNAIEHAEGCEPSYISVLSYRKKNAYMIEINNSFCGVLQWDPESGLPVSSKKEEKGQGYEKNHGYGLSNIQRIAEKYAGDIDVVLKEGKFCLSILLMLE